jgi:hypothetical protein
MISEEEAKRRGLNTARGIVIALIAAALFWLAVIVLAWRK